MSDAQSVLSSVGQMTGPGASGGGGSTSPRAASTALAPVIGQPVPNAGTKNPVLPLADLMQLLNAGAPKRAQDAPQLNFGGAGGGSGAGAMGAIMSILSAIWQASSAAAAAE